MGAVNNTTKKITVTNVPPTKVSLRTPELMTATSIKISWYENTDYDFDRYEIHMSTNPNFIPSTSTLTKTITLRYTTSYTISGLSPDTKYYFKIRTYDTNGLYTDSEVVSAITPSVGGGDVFSSIGNICATFWWVIVIVIIAIILTAVSGKKK